MHTAHAKSLHVHLSELKFLGSDSAAVTLRHEKTLKKFKWLHESCYLQKNKEQIQGKFAKAFILQESNAEQCRWCDRTN